MYEYFQYLNTKLLTIIEQGRNLMMTNTTVLIVPVLYH